MRRPGLAVILVTSLGVAARAQDSSTSELESRMLSRLNQDRAAQALPPLQANEGLADVARGHSRDMVEGGYFDHVSPGHGRLRDRLGKAGIEFARAGENLARDLSLEGAADSLLASASHRVNILSSDFTHVGVGIVRKGPWLYVTQDFVRFSAARKRMAPEPDPPVASIRAEFLGGALRGY